MVLFFQVVDSVDVQMVKVLVVQDVDLFVVPGVVFEVDQMEVYFVVQRVDR